MKRTRTRAPLTTLLKIDRVQVIQVMEDMLNVVASASEEKNNPQPMYDDKAEVRKVMGYLLDQVVLIKPKRIRIPRIETVSIQEQPVVEVDLPFVPKTLEEIQRDGWDFNDFVISLPLLVSEEEVHREALKLNVYSNERTLNFNRQTDIESPDYNPVFQPLRFIVLENPSQLLWQQMFGMTQGPVSSLSSLSQVPDNQLRGEPPKRRSRPSEMIKIHNSDLPTLPKNEEPRSQIMTPETVVLEQF